MEKRTWILAMVSSSILTANQLLTYGDYPFLQPTSSPSDPNGIWTRCYHRERVVSLTARPWGLIYVFFFRRCAKKFTLNFRQCANMSKNRGLYTRITGMVGFEPTTPRLTAECSTVELQTNNMKKATIYATRWHLSLSCFFALLG